MLILFVCCALALGTNGQKWDAKVLTEADTASITIQSMEESERTILGQLLRAERLKFQNPVTVILGTSSTTVQKPELSDGKYSAINGQSAESTTYQFTVKITEGSSTPMAAFISKIRLVSPRAEEMISAIEEVTLTVKDEAINITANGYHIFTPPIAIAEFKITMKFKVSAQYDVYLSEIEVLGPANYGARKTVLISKDSGDDISFDEAKELCGKHGGYVSSERRKGPADYWMGYIGICNVGDDSPVPLWDDGTYSTLSYATIDPLTSSTTLVCTESAVNQECHANGDAGTPSQVLCAFPDVQYYTVKHQNDAPIDEQCLLNGGGVAVTPSSTLEVETITKQYPGEDLLVAACLKRAQREPVVKLTGKLECSTTEHAILYSNGSLAALYGEDDLAEPRHIACKKSTRTSLISSEDLNGGSITNGKSSDYLLDGVTRKLPEVEERVDRIVILLKSVMDLEEIRLFVMYNESFENSYGEVKLQCTGENKDPNITVQYISLSKERSFDFHNLEYDQECRSVILDWNKQIPISEIQIVKKLSSLQISSLEGVEIKYGSTITLTCKAETPAFVDIKWYYDQAADSVSTLCHATMAYTENGTFVSSLVIQKDGYYQCKMDSISSSSLNIILARTCDTADIDVNTIDTENGFITENTHVPIHSPVNVTCKEGYIQIIAIKCLEGGQFDVSPDTTKELCDSKMKKELEELNESYKKGVNEEIISAQLLEVVKENLFVHEDDIDNALLLLETITKNSFEDTNVLVNCFKTANAVMKKMEDKLDTVQRCLDVVDDIGKGSKKELALVESGLALKAVDIAKNDKNVVFALYNKTLASNMKVFTWDIELDKAANSIVMPSFSDRFWFTIYNNTMYQNKTASLIVGANLKNTKLGGIPFSTNITLQKLYYGASANCVYWDKKTKSWSTNNVIKIAETSEYVTCETRHLTSFAILMTRDDSFIPKTHRYILDFISIGGCVISCICLLLTIIGLMRFPDIRNMTDSKIHINFSIALLGALLSFLIFIDQTENEIVCKAGAMLLQYLLTVSVVWMLCEAVNLYMSLTAVFTNNNHLVLMMTFAWGIPGLMVLLTVVNGLDNYENESGCWLSPNAMYWWFAGPVIIIAVVNIVFYVLVMRSIATHARLNKISSMSDLRSCFCMLIVLGCTWVFGFFTILTDLLIFQYLFALCNSMQGFCVFYCYCGSKQYIVLSWKSSSTRNSAPFKNEEFTMKSKIVNTNGETKTTIKSTTKIQKSWVNDNDIF